MKTDKTQLIQAIETIKAKLAQMEEELNKPEGFKHFPVKNDEYYYYSSIGYIDSNIANTDAFRVNVFKSWDEAEKAYTKDVALEKVKRRLLELQGDWRSNFDDDCSKLVIFYNYNNIRFECSTHTKVKFPLLIPYIKTSEIAKTIINEMEDELNLIFEIQ